MALGANSVHARRLGVRLCEEYSSAGPSRPLFLVVVVVVVVLLDKVYETTTTTAFPATTFARRGDSGAAQRGQVDPL
jgi:hypothetical protein